MGKNTLQTKIGNIALSKGAYMALMKRRAGSLYQGSISCQNSPESNNKYLSKFQSIQKKQSTSDQYYKLERGLFNSKQKSSHKIINQSKKIKKQVTQKTSTHLNVENFANKENQNFSQRLKPNKETSKFQPKTEQLQNKTKLQNLQQWHKIVKTSQTTHTIYLNSNLNPKKKMHKQFVPGYEIKFIQQKKNQIYSFNCFREKDLSIESQNSKIISLNMDNDCPTDDEQLSAAIKNMFYSLCISIHEEKILNQEKKSFLEGCNQVNLTPNTNILDIHNQSSIN